MPIPPRDGRRRNRNIGTAKSGHGVDNRLVTPDGPDFSMFYQNLADFRVWTAPAVTYLIERPSPGFTHAVTPEDVERLLALLPEEDREDLQLVVLRQPKRKERILSPAWGRLVFCYETNGYGGRAVLFEAQDTTKPLKWSVSLTPDEADELERLRADGHEIERTKRSFLITSTPESVRATQLYRTLPHEIGHLKQWSEHPAYDTLSSKEKEAYAHRYATEFAQRARAIGAIPFERQEHQGGIDPSWFADSS